MFRSMILGLALVAGMSTAAHAQTAWVVDPASSQVGFEYLKDGAPTEGVFREFSGAGTFDSSAPEAARFQISIASASIDLFDSLASAFATSAEWFDSKNNPNVVYVLQDLKPLGGDRYAASGTIQIRGVEKPMTSEIALKIGSSDANASGTLTIRRADFLLGVGPSAAFVEVGPDVQVTFALIARQGG
ncbi:MAG: YceI family protein [Paracoccaceae bacterium]